MINKSLDRYRKRFKKYKGQQEGKKGRKGHEEEGLKTR